MKISIANKVCTVKVSIGNKFVFAKGICHPPDGDKLQQFNEAVQ